MALTECRECKGVVSTTAKACPHCGAKKKQTSGLVKVILVLFTVIIVLPTIVSLIFSRGPETEKANAQKEKIDYSKPVFTTDRAIICSQGLLLSALFEKRADHGFKEIYGLWTTFWHRSEKVKELGCEEWQAGIRVYAQPMEQYPGFVGLGLTRDGAREYFTMEPDLENHDEAVLEKPQLSASAQSKPLNADVPAREASNDPPKVDDRDSGYSSQKFVWDKPAILNGSFNTGTFTDCCVFGKETQETYHFIHLDKNIDVVSQANDGFEETLRNVEAIQLSENANNDFRNLKEGQNITVSCKKLSYGITGHYALPTYCEEATLKE